MTRPLRLGFLLLGIILVTAAPGFSAGARAICPLKEVRAGQRASAKSVFRGTRIETFHLEILGILHKFDGTRSVILARILDGPVVARKSGVIGGMSGSPVYIDGRIAGAIALTWPWSKEPIAGITPIEEMLAAWDEAPAAESSSQTGRSLSSPLRIEGTPINRMRVAPTPPANADPPGVMTLVPVSGFVQASGFNARSVEQLSELLSPYGLRVVQGPGGGMQELRPPLVPGAALGVQLIGGDFSMTVLGTVTLVEGERVLGFGHPILQRGSVDLPMTGGYVHDILPSLFVSNKIMSATKVVGRIQRDHQSAVAGEVGAEADLLPVTIEVTDNDFGGSRKFEVAVVRVREMLPALVASSVLTAIDETRGRVARGMSRVIVEIEAEGRPPIVREDLGYSNMDAAAAASSAILAPLATFTDSPFGKLRVNEVRVRVETEEIRKTASIERVTMAQSRVEAGDEVTLNVALRPYGQDIVEVPVQLAIPPDLPRGQVRVVVSGGGDAAQARSAIGAPRPQPVSLSQLVERYISQEQNSDLVVQAALTRKGVSLLGEELPDLPRSVFDALRATHPTDLRLAPSLVKVVVPTQWILVGRQVLALQVDSPLAPGRPGPPKPPQGEPGDEGEEAAVRDSVSPVPVGQLAPAPPVAVAERRPAPERPAKEKEEPKPLTRGPETWIHEDGSDHSEAELRGIAVSEEGRLSLAPKTTELAAIPADVVWSLAVRDGMIYVGTGGEGVIYRVSESGEVSEFFATGEMNVHALVFDDDGALFAATSPRGKLFRITPEGEGELLYDSSSTYLWSLVIGSEGTLYAAGGSPASIYQIPTDGEARVLVELPAANVLSLAHGEGGDLYAGTSDNGVIYRVGPDGSATAVCRVPGDSVDAMVVTDDGDLYAAASPRGEVYRLPAEGLPVQHCATGQQSIYGLALLPDGDLMAATGPRGLLIRVGSDGKAQIVFRPETGLATAIAEADGVVYAGSSGPALVRKLGPGYTACGSLESAALDAARIAHWGRLDWLAETPEGTEVRAETRSGDSPLPDDHWNSWTGVEDSVVASAPARYLQYRLTLRTEDSSTTPVVQQVRVSHRPQNRRPVCVVKSPKAGEWVAKQQKVAWQARDPDKDTLAYEVAISADLGKTWEPVERDLRKSEYEWDTTEREDGRYFLRVTASDALSVPAEPQAAEASMAVWVDNTAPDLVLLRSSLVVGDDERARVSVMASDAMSPIRSVEYRVDDGKWRSLALSSVESSLAGHYVTDASVVTDALEAGTHALEVRAFDAAGNLATDSVSVTVEESDTATGEESDTATGEESDTATGEESDTAATPQNRSEPAQ